MRVLHVIPSIGSQRGGPSVAAPAMCRALGARGVTCDLVATNDNGPGFLDVPTGEWTMQAGVRTLFFPRGGNFFRPLREFQFGKGFAAWIGAHVRDYDLIHVHALFSHLSSVAMRAAGRASVPCVLRPLGLLEHYSLGRSAWKKKAFLRLWDEANIRRAAAIHLTSQRELDVSWLPGAAARWVVPLGVDLPQEEAREALPRGSGVPQLIFLSRWHAKKRIGVLVEALARLKGRPWHLVLAGTGTPEIAREVREAVRAAGLGDRVSLPGFLEGAAKWSALRAADLFVLPSASENFGIAVAEALAAGTPAVITRHVALAPEIEAAGAGWICGDNAGALADVLAEALANPSEIARRGANARRLAEECFSWESAAGKLEPLYRSLHK